jgi:Holliday junction resolvase RusA-like endonuclease
MSVIAFTILGQPVSHKNGYHIVTLGKGPTAVPRIVKSKEALAWERDALRQIPPAARQRIEGPVRITLRCFYANERPDLDESLVLDVLQDRFVALAAFGTNGPKQIGKRQLSQAGVYRNDRQVREKHVYHGIDAREPRVEIVVEALQAQQAALSLPERDLAEELLG